MGDDGGQIPMPQRKEFHHPQFWLCVMLTGMVCMIIAGEFFLPVPEANQRVIDTLSGSVVTAWLGALAYWYNTTFGSNNKTDIISKLPAIKE